MEVASDIEVEDEVGGRGKSALEMALEYRLTSFVANNRIERISASIMNDFEFLRPKNSDDAFEIDVLSIKFLWKQLKKPQFYFTAIGTYIVIFVLYLLYLALFTYLSISQFKVYDEMANHEIVFWIFNIGYVAHGVQLMISNGIKKYYSETINYFDTVISIVFLISISIRLYALYGPDSDLPLCPWEEDDYIAPITTLEPINYDTDDCWSSSGTLNTAFVILWGIATIVLWLRLFNFCVLSHSLGPMVLMIFKMVDDIVTFFEIMLILFLGFTMCLMFIMGSVHDGFSDPFESGMTLFRAILGDFDFEGFYGPMDDPKVNTALVCTYYFIP